MNYPEIPDSCLCRDVYIVRAVRVDEAGDQPLAALVACVWSDTCVNLAIFDGNGAPMPKPPTSVLLLQEGNPTPIGGNYCMWMPYQVGQAKKHESDPK